MILTNYLAGNQRFKRGSVEIVGGGNTHYVTDTSITLTMPAGVLPGDLLLAFLFHRADLAGHPGWNEVGASSISASGVTQVITVLSRVTLLGDGDFTFAQIALARLGGHICALRAVEGQLVIIDIEKDAEVRGEFSADLPLTQLPAGGGVVVAGVTSVLAASGTTTSLSVTSGWQFSSEVSRLENRLGVVYRESGASLNAIGVINGSGVSGDNGVASIALAIVAR